MGKLYTKGSPISNVYSVGINAPFDDRLTVNKKSDLTDGENGIASKVYTGMVVYVHEEQALYMYVGSSKSSYINTKTNTPINGGLESNWIKLGTDDITTEDYAAVVLDSVDGLTSISTPTPYKGMTAVVRESGSESEDEISLYVLIDDDATVSSNWIKVSGTTTNTIEPERITNDDISALFDSSEE